MERGHGGGVSGLALVSGGLCLGGGGVAGLGRGSLGGNGGDRTAADIALHTLGADDCGGRVAAGVANIDVALAGPVVITALLAGGVLDAPGAVGNGLIDLLLLLGAGIHSRGVVLGGRGGRLGHDRLRRGGRGGAIPKDGVEVQVVAHLLDVDVPEQFIVAQGRGGVDAEPAVCRDPVGHRLAVHGAGHLADAAVKHCVGLDRCVVGVVVDVGRIAGDGHKVRAGGAVGAGAVIGVHAGAEPIIQLIIAELLAGHDVLAVALPVLGTLRQGGCGDGAGIVRGEGHRVVAIEGELVGVQVAQRLAGLGESRDRHADGQRGDTEGNGEDFGKLLFHDKVPFYVEN